MAAQKTRPGRNHIFVAAIDFGTSYSGYAFSSMDAFKKDPVDISTIIWRSGSTCLLSPKAPTCILFDKNKQFSAFGYEAENEYSDLAFDNKHKEWYFFRNFKMSLYDKQAGIEDASLMLALEPEAASIYCANLKIESDGRGLSGLEPGSKYMVVDAGGGTVDITVHSIGENRVIDELLRASGGDWGGSYVDAAFMKFLETLCGSKVMKIFRKENIGDMLDIQRDFETKKRDMSAEQERAIHLRFPIILHELFRKENKGKDITTRIKEISLEDDVTIVRDKMRIGHLRFGTFFDQAHRDLVCHIQQLFEQDQVRNVSTLLLVGGFCESRLLQEVLRESLPDKRIIIPPDPGLAVLKGAVVFGHDPSIIKTRISRYTYGFSVFGPLTDRHLKDDRFSKSEIVTDTGGIKLIKSSFSKHVTKGQILEVDEAQCSQQYTSIDGGDFTLYLYMSHELDPVFVTDLSCHLIGRMEINVKDLSDTSVHVNLRFGDTKIKVEVVKLETGKREEMAFDCLD